MPFSKDIQVKFTLPNKKILIYCHRDFDGIASAGLFIRYLLALGITQKEDIKTTFADYGDIKSFAVKKFKNTNLIVLDFPYHPDAAVWIDHHKTSFVIAKPEKIGYRLLWDDKAKSCPELLVKYIKKNNPEVYDAVIGEYEAVVFFSKVIDSALYKTPEAVYNYANPFFALNQLMNDEKGDYYKKRFLDAIVNDCLISMFTSRAFSAKQKNLINQYKLVLANIDTFAEKHENILILDYIKAGLPFYRYIGYIKYPTVLFTITLTTVNGKYHLGAGFNPWAGESPINIGEIFSKIGGGGRLNVGAVLVNSISSLNKKKNFVVKNIMSVLSTHDTMRTVQKISRVISSKKGSEKDEDSLLLRKYLIKSSQKRKGYNK
jgi:hypothetical protein